MIVEMKLINNYHTHTKRCGHALGEDEDYVKAAIKVGIKELGFSDHVPFKGVTQRGVRMDYEQLDDYISSINALKEKYKDQIKIYLGFEAEYYHEANDYYLELLNKVDYLICGQHFSLNKKENVYVGFKHDNKEVAEHYTIRVIEAIKSGLFKYIAHPDIILRSYTLRDDFIEDQMRQICKAAEEYKIPLEINLEGMRKKVMIGDPFGDNYYPYPFFWNIAKDYDIEVIIGADVHDPSHFEEDYDTFAREIVEKYRLKLIDHIDI